ncbi:MAG TPA: 50S ribosomal protein L4 [Thermodesulfobacteriota bacterium]|nr:50S ribosomal protein L4 [Deltaproteobacteria bacterium]HLB05766.1 50S ribosomal protein L4 [Thermodesulfobacteriota bacterium]
MPHLDVYDIERKKVGEIDLSDEMFGAEVKEHLIHEVVKMQLANRRAGTSSTKSRGEVSGGNRKPWKQKGTGRARSGSNTSPIWVRGGCAFGPKPRDYSYLVPKKVRKGALKSVLSMKMNEGKVWVIRDFDLSEIKTKKALEILQRFEAENALFVSHQEMANFERSSRNLRGFKVIRPQGLNVYDVLSFDKILILESTAPVIGGDVKGEVSE